MERRGFIGFVLALIAAPAFGGEWERTQRRWMRQNTLRRRFSERRLVLAPTQMRLAFDEAGMPVGAKDFLYLHPHTNEWLPCRRWHVESYLPPNYKSPAQIWFESWVKR